MDSADGSSSPWIARPSRSTGPAHLWSATKQAAPSFRVLGERVGTTVVSRVVGL